MDIYFRQEYAQLCAFIDDGTAEEFVFQGKNGFVRNQFIKREIPMLVEGKQYYDIVTPYGYGGPVINCSEDADKEALLQEFEAAFAAYCQEQHIVSEFIRFHPLYENAQDFQSVYDACPIRKTVGTNLADYDDPVQSEFGKSCRKRIRKLLESGKYTMDDLRMHGILHQYMMQISRDKALALFDRALKLGPAEDAEVYWCTWRQKISMLCEIGRGQEGIDAFLPAVESGSGILDEWICLIHAYDRNGQSDMAWEWAKKAEQKFPESAMLHIYSGDLCKALGRYEDAFAHWQRAKEMEPTWMDSWYAMGFCYEELGDYANAHQIWNAIADDLAARGFEAEVTWPRAQAKKCLEKMQK